MPFRAIRITYRRQIKLSEYYIEPKRISHYIINKWSGVRKHSCLWNLSVANNHAGLPCLFPSSLLSLSPSLSPKHSWLGAYQAVISDTFSTRDVYWCIWEEKANWVVAWLESQFFLKIFPLFTSLPLSISPHSLSLSLSPSLSLLPCEPGSSLEKWGAALVFFACLCNRKRCTSGAPSADRGDADGRWKSSLVAVRPCSDVIAAARMKSALTKCAHWWMDKAGNWMWEWMGPEWELNTDKQNERQRGITC